MVQVRRQFRLYFTGSLGEVAGAWGEEGGRRPALEGVIHDPGVQGNREVRQTGVARTCTCFQVSVLYSAEFRRIMMERNKAKPDPFRVMLESSIKDMLPR